MKTTLITTFAIAVMVCTFNPTSVTAGEDVDKGFEDMGKLLKCNFEGLTNRECREQGRVSELDDLDEKDSDQPNNEREVADSGNEGSTSAASASDQ